MTVVSTNTSATSAVRIAKGNSLNQGRFGAWPCLKENLIKSDTNRDYPKRADKSKEDMKERADSPSRF
jgi:hypothetical protein